MKLLILFLASIAALQAQLVTISDTIRRQDNSTPSGYMEITLRNPCTAPASAGGPATVPLSTAKVTVTVTSGVFSVSLYATRTCVPAGAYYEVRYFLSDGVDRDVPRYWTFDYTASTLTIASIQSTLRPNQNSILLSQLTNAQGNTGKVLCSDGSNWLACNSLADPTTTRGDLIYRGAAGLIRLGVGTNGQVLTSNGTDPVWGAGGGGSGTVTSVGLSAPAIFSVTGSPVTSSGTISLSLATQSANTIFAGPTSGGAAAPTFRALVASDIPALSYVAPARAINTTAPIAGGGDLSADRTISLSLATGGFLGTTGGLGLIRTCSTNQIPKWDGSQWACAADETGAGGSGITSLGGLTGSTQSLATGTSGTDFSISSVGSTHTFNIPSASGTNRGLLTSADWTTFNNKVGTHAMLSATHTDTTAGTVARGDMLAGIGSSPTWQRVAVGAQGRFWRVNAAGQEPAWGDLTLSHAASDPPTVVSVTAAQTAASHSGGTDFVEIRGNLLYMVLLDATNSGIEVWDIGRPTSPKHVGSLTLTGFPFCAFITIAHPYMYVGCQSNKIGVVDITNPASMSVAATITTTQVDNQRMRVLGNRLIAGASASVEIFNVTVPTSPKQEFYSTSIGGKNFAVQGDMAYFINNSFGSGGTISILNMRTLTQAGTVAIGTTIGVAPNAIAVDGSYLYVAGGVTGGKLRTYDIKNPASPVQVGSDLTVDASGFAHMWMANDRYIYLNSDASPTGKLHVVDISTAGSPSLINTIDLGNRPDNMAVSGCHIFIANYTDETLNAIKLPNCLDAPGADIGNLRSSTINVSGDGVINGQLRLQGAAIGTDGIGSAGPISSRDGMIAPSFTIHAATAPSNPASGRVILYADSGDSNRLKTKDSAGTVEPIAKRGAGTPATNDCAQFDSNLRLVSFGAPCYTEPSAIDFTGKTSTAPNKAGTTLPATCTVGQTYLKTDATAAAVIYACTATNTWTQQVGTGGGGSPGGSNTQLQYNSSGSFAGSSSATMMAALTLAVTQTVNTSTGTKQPLAVAIQGRYMYVVVNDSSTAGNNYLEAWDTSVRATPVFAGSVTTNARGATFLDVSGDYAYVANTTEGTVSIIKITNPASMTVVGTITFATVQQVRVRGRWLFLGTQGTTLPIYDISNPASPVQRANLASAGGKNLALDERYAYMVNNSGNSLIIVDAEDPTNPAVRSTTSLGTDVATIVNAVAVSGRYLYLGGTVSSPKLAVYNVANPASPALLNNSIVQDFGTTPQFVIAGNYLVAAQDVTSANVRIYDISAPAAPSFIESASAGNRASSLAVSGEMIVVANAGAATFSILQMPRVSLQSARIGSLETEQFRALGESRIEGALNVSGGLTVGRFGIRSDGHIAAPTTATNVIELFAVADPGSPGSSRARLFLDSGNSNKPSIRDSSGTMPLAFISGSYATNDCVKFDASGNLVSAGAACGSGGGGGLADPGANGIVVRTSSTTTINRTITGTSGRVAVTSGDGVSGNPTIDIDSNVAMRNAANTYLAGGKQTIQHDASLAGLRIAAASGTPSSLTDGDLWLTTSAAQISARLNGATVRIQTATGSTTTNNCAKFDASGNVVDSGAVCGGGGGGAINSGAGAGLWYPFGLSSYVSGGVSIGGTPKAYRYQLMVMNTMEFRRVNFKISTVSGTCTSGCGLRIAIYNHAMTSQVALSEVANSGNATNEKNINLAGVKSLIWESGSSVSSNVLTLAAGTYWLVIGAQGTGALSSYSDGNGPDIADLGTASTRIAYTSTSPSTGDGASFTLNGDISGSSWTHNNGAGVVAVTAFLN